jgi:hypothetical protein
MANCFFIYAQEEEMGEELRLDGRQDDSGEAALSVEDPFNDALKVLVNVEGIDYSISGGATITVTDGEVTKRLSLKELTGMLGQSGGQTSVQVPFLFNKGMIEVGEQFVACIRLSGNQAEDVEQQQLQGPGQQQQQKETGNTNKPHCTQAVNTPEKKPEVVTIPL